MTTVPERRHFTFYSERTASGFAVTVAGVPVLTYDNDGDHALISEGTSSMLDVDPADMLRWGAPHALALHGRPCLHGAAVDLDGSLAVFLGVGGAGKSTLARTLGGVGLAVVLDDLLVLDDRGRCDIAAEQVVRGWAQDAVRRGPAVSYHALAGLVAAKSVWRPIGLVAVLGPRLAFEADHDMSGEQHEGDDYSLHRLTRREALLAINEHRFGSHPLAAAWPVQLAAALSLADKVPTIRLSVVDGLERLRDAAPRLAAALRATTHD